MMGKRIRYIGRYRDIAVALVRHGFGLLVEELGFTNLLSLPQRLFAGPTAQDWQNAGERIRLVLEELGPTFVKLGQIASTRSELIPPDVVRELEKLQDQVPPFPFSEVSRIVEAELGGPILQLFQQFEEQPLAAASIGQVHRAVLPSGETVAVKIQRPGISQKVETDLDILYDLAQIAEHRLEWASRYQLREIVEEFAKALRNELDYTIEGRHAELIAKQFQNDKNIYIPRVYWDYTTKKLLTTKYIEGVKVNEGDKLREKGYHPRRLAERLTQAVFQQIFSGGVFHGDPHPGNLLVLPGEVIAFLDFGMVGRLSSTMKHHFSSLVIALMRQSTDGVLKAIYRMGVVPDDVNRMRLREDVDALREKYIGVPLSQVSLGQAVNDLFSVAFRHRIHLPPELTLLGKTLLTLEGVVVQLDPQFRIFDIAEPVGRQLLKERLRPKTLFDSVWNNVTEYGEILLELPGRVQDVTSLIKKGRLRMEISLAELELLLAKLDRISNRLSFSVILLALSIIMAAIIIGSSFGAPSTESWQIPAMAIGFGVAFLMVIWLLYSIFKSGRL